MGLDIYHYHASDELVDPDDRAYVHEFTEEVLEDYGFKRFLTQVPDYQDLHTIYLFDSLNVLKIYEATEKKEGGVSRTLIVGDLKSTKDKIAEIERDKKLTIDQRIELPFSVTSLTGETYRCMSLPYAKNITSPGIWFKEVGYQRGWMRPEFSDYCKSDYMHARKRCFTDMLRYVYSEAPQEDIDNIRNKFVNNYQRGRSIMWVSG